MHGIVFTTTATVHRFGLWLATITPATVPASRFFISGVGLSNRVSAANHTPYAQNMATDRTTLRLSDERKRLLDQATEIVASDEHDDPPRSDVIDAALTHLIESKANIDEARTEYPPATVQACCNTSVLRLHYRTSIDQDWR